ncbi:MAG: AAA family ATPase [Bacilli bacterium]|nr:AAA family ATPase [Bacilli bacterium]
MQEKDVFKDIIGYEDIKNSLRMIIDVLNNREKYEKLGCTIPHGLLLHGEPGTGKTSLATMFLDNVNRKSFVIRKIKSDGSFIDHVNKVFEDAVKQQPSIILLDDIDKFSECEDDRSNNEEYVVIQSLIDDVKDKDVFIIATANSINNLPDSLKRAGRFDTKIEINNPKEKEANKIFKHYLDSKSVEKNINIKNISSILNGRSCADLEKVCNQAGIYAGYKNSSVIGMEDLLRAALEIQYDCNYINMDEDDEDLIKVAYHEAGHALIGELLEKNSVSFITIMKNDGDIQGFTSYHNNDKYFSSFKLMENRVKALLAGKASTEIVYNECDVGTYSDIDRAFKIASRFIDDYCMDGFNYRSSNNYRDTSINVQNDFDKKVRELIDKYYNEVKLLLVQNRKELDKLANELKKKKVLFQEEIDEILKGNYGIRII